VNRADFQILAKDRLGDAKALLAAKRWAGAYYMAGYAVECALKACIAKLVKAEEFPEKAFADKCWTHSLSQLLVVAGLKDPLDNAMKADHDLRNNWINVKDWNEAARYERKTKADAVDLYAAITNKEHGVFSWLKSHS
jgi:HEPN domain-containing protein